MSAAEPLLSSTGSRDTTRSAAMARASAHELHVVRAVENVSFEICRGESSDSSASPDAGKRRSGAT